MLNRLSLDDTEFAAWASAWSTCGSRAARFSTARQCRVWRSMSHKATGSNRARRALRCSLRNPDWPSSADTPWANGPNSYLCQDNKDGEGPQSLMDGYKGPSETTEIAVRGVSLHQFGRESAHQLAGSGAGPEGSLCSAYTLHPTVRPLQNLSLSLLRATDPKAAQRRRARGGGPNAQSEGHCCRSSHFPWRGGSCRCGRGNGADHEGVQSPHRQSCWRPDANHMEAVSQGAYLHD
jgi:hypothetical protein